MIAGVATDTMVVSTMIMKKPSTSAQRAGHGSFSSVRERGVGSGVESGHGHTQPPVSDNHPQA